MVVDTIIGREREKIMRLIGSNNNGLIGIPQSIKGQFDKNNVDELSQLDGLSPTERRLRESQLAYEKKRAERAERERIKRLEEEAAAKERAKELEKERKKQAKLEKAEREKELRRRECYIDIYISIIYVFVCFICF